MSMGEQATVVSAYVTYQPNDYPMQLSFHGSSATSYLPGVPDYSDAWHGILDKVLSVCLVWVDREQLVGAGGVNSSPVSTSSLYVCHMYA